MFSLPQPSSHVHVHVYVVVVVIIVIVVIVVVVGVAVAVDIGNDVGGEVEGDEQKRQETKGREAASRATCFTRPGSKDAKRDSSVLFFQVVLIFAGKKETKKGYFCQARTHPKLRIPSLFVCGAIP